MAARRPALGPRIRTTTTPDTFEGGLVIENTYCDYPNLVLSDDVLKMVNEVTCDECWPETHVVWLPADVIEITVTHSPNCGLSDTVYYA